MQIDRDTIIKLARKAGLAHFYDTEGHCTGITDARLVTEAKERNDDRLVKMLAPFAKLVAEHEREACAKVCDELIEASEPVSIEAGEWTLGTEDCAAAIRARGNT